MVGDKAQATGNPAARKQRYHLLAYNLTQQTTPLTRFLHKTHISRNTDKENNKQSTTALRVANRTSLVPSSAPPKKEKKKKEHQTSKTMNPRREQIRRNTTQQSRSSGIGLLSSSKQTKTGSCSWNQRRPRLHSANNSVLVAGSHV